MTSYLLDTGFLYADIDRTDNRHLDVKGAIERIRGNVILPVPVITETTYFLSRNLGLKAVAQFLDNLEVSGFIVENPTPEDYVRSAEILRKYNDAKIDFVDVCIVAMAERLNITKILTIDRRHFNIFRPKHCGAFEILP
jgi:predicted nucleic acid-binding protein